MTCVVGPDGNGRIMEAAQDYPTPTAPTPAMTSLIPVPHHWVRRSISNDDLIASIDRVTDRLAECQLLVDSVLDQSKASYEFLRSKITIPLQPSDLLGHIIRGG